MKNLNGLLTVKNVSFTWNEMKLTSSCLMFKILTNCHESHHPLETLLFTFGFGKLTVQLVAPLKVVIQQKAILQLFTQLKSFDLEWGWRDLVVVETGI